MMTGRAWKKKVDLMVDSKDKEFVDVTQDPLETLRTMRHSDLCLSSDLSPGKLLKSDSNLEVAVFDILGQRGVEELLEVLNQTP